MIILKRLYVENYKLFSEKEIDFSKALLSVFDGPNGYGKTSIFDAIELLITGKISRVLTCESIDKKTAYQTVFFAKDREKDVILKAEFEVNDNNRCFVLGARVQSATVNGKPANPKNIFDNIEYFYMPNYDISIDSWMQYKKNSDEIEELRRQEFGQRNIEQFTLFHYVRQEDRLAYFKQSETSRATTIEDLLGVANEREKFKQIQSRRKAVDKVYKEIKEKIDSKRKYVLENEFKNDPTTKYEPLLDGVQIWDKENVSFGNSNQDKVLAQYNNEIEKLENYVKYAHIHDKFFADDRFKKIPEKLRDITLQAAILLQKTPMKVEEIDKSFQDWRFLNQQLDYIKSQKYKSIDFQRICQVTAVPEDESLLSDISSLNEMLKNQGELQKAINNVIQIREDLHSSHKKISDNGICPYCGHNWEKQEELEKQFTTTKSILHELLTQDGERYAKKLEIVKTKIEDSILEEIKNKIKQFSEIKILSVYGEYGTKATFISAIDNVKPLFKISQATIENTENDDEYLKRIKETCVSIGNEIPVEYISANNKYSFFEVRKKYTLNDKIISKLGKEQFDKKRQYLQEQFYKSFDTLREEINELETKRETIEIIKNQLKEYENAFKNSLEAYKKLIIDEIEIPFFVYSSRLLQSYQGGQGVLMKNDGGSIRFTSPGNEHDVLYTMSSGQLSAVLLSFSLALNKIYSGQGIKTLLIDDPIQCMDDINMISFVELLRREFSDCQIVLSTHEEDFSNFVRYKFKKYGLDTQAITLKDA